jgi:hemoglobin
MRTMHGWRRAALAACALALACSGGLGAQQDTTKPGGTPLDRKAVDGLVYNTLRDVINQGADLYNPPADDWNGCYRLYEGALMALRPMLDHRPELQKAIDTGLATARANPVVQQRAFDLRRVINRIRDDTNPKGPPKPPVAAKTLWDRLGGEDNVRKVVNDFVGGAATDPKVDFSRGGKYPLNDDGVKKLKQLLVEQISSASGGPLKYTGKSMKELHKGMEITDAQFDAAAAHLKAAQQKNGAKADDVDAVLKAVDDTRKDIVEGKKPDK